MATNKQEILNKEQPTGKDVGRLLLLSATNLVNDIELVEQSEYQESVEQLTDQNEITEFLLYRAWYDVLVNSKTYTGGILQQIGKGFSILNEALKKAKIAENEEIENEQTPLCMTVEEYEAYKAGTPLKEYRYNEQQRIEQSGICVAAMVKENRIDKNNCFINFFNTAAQPFSLLAIIQSEETVNHLKNVYNNIMGYSVSYFYSYNKVISILAEIAEVEEIKNFCINMYAIEKSIDILNNSIEDIYNHKHGNEELQKTKEKIIKTVFPIINYKALRQPRANKELKEEIKTYLTTQNIDVFEFNRFVERHMKGGANGR